MRGATARSLVFIEVSVPKGAGLKASFHQGEQHSSDFRLFGTSGSADRVETGSHRVEPVSAMN
jgi:hypothetical protein